MRPLNTNLITSQSSSGWPQNIEPNLGKSKLTEFSLPGIVRGPQDQNWPRIGNWRPKCPHRVVLPVSDLQGANLHFAHCSELYFSHQLDLLPELCSQRRGEEERGFLVCRTVQRDEWASHIYSLRKQDYLAGTMSWSQTAARTERSLTRSFFFFFPQRDLTVKWELSMSGHYLSKRRSKHSRKIPTDLCTLHWREVR